MEDKMFEETYEGSLGIIYSRKSGLTLGANPITLRLVTGLSDQTYREVLSYLELGQKNLPPFCKVSVSDGIVSYPIDSTLGKSLLQMAGEVTLHPNAVHQKGWRKSIEKDALQGVVGLLSNAGVLEKELVSV